MGQTYSPLAAVGIDLGAPWVDKTSKDRFFPYKNHGFATFNFNPGEIGASLESQILPNYTYSVENSPDLTAGGVFVF